MKMKGNRLIALILALAMALSLVACGGSSSSSGGNAKNDATASTGTTDPTALSADDPLVIWAWDESFNLPAMQDAIDLYCEQNGVAEGAIKIDYMGSDDVNTALTTAATSGDYSQLPDITLLQDHNYQKYLASYEGLFTDLKDSGIDFSQFAAYKTSYSSYNGGQYAVPFDSGCVIACYRTDVLEEAGYTVDDLTDITWTEFNTIGADIFAKTGKHLLSERTNQMDTLMMMLQSAGGSMFNDDGSINLTMDNAPLVNTMAAFKDMVDSGTMEMISSWDEYIASFSTKETTVGVVNGAWILGSIEGGNDTQEGKWAMTTMPALDGVDGATHYSNNGGASWAVLSSSDKATVAIDLLKNTFASAENAETLFADILHDSTAISTFQPALDADIYTGTLSKFGDQEIYGDIAEWAPQVPTSADSLYYYEALNVLATGLTKYIDGTSIEDALAEATSNYETQVG